MSAAESWGRWGGESGGLLDRITDILSGIFRQKTPLKKKLTEIAILLDEQERKLDTLLYRLEERSRDLFDKTVKAYISKDMARAAIYAGEVAEVRKIAKTVATIRLALEKIVLRLETVQELGEVGATLAPLASLLQGMKQWVAGIVPEVAYGLEEVSRAMNEIILEAGTMSEHTVSLGTLNEDTIKILEEAKSVAELKIEERFPKLPVQLEKLAENTAMKVPAMGPAPKVAPRRGPGNIEEKVLRYIRENNGFLDVAQCAKSLGVSREDVVKALESLKRKGKIKLG